jgi:hypothetical protein
MDSTEPWIHPESIHGPLAEDHPINLWHAHFTKVVELTGLAWDVAPYLKKWMEEAGFINVTEKVIRVAIGKWPKDPKQKELGTWNQLRLDMGFGDFTERRLRNVLNVRSFPDQQLAVLLIIFSGSKMRFWYLWRKLELRSRILRKGYIWMCKLFLIGPVSLVD